MGWTLADIPERLTWRAVWAFLTHCPGSSATYRARQEWAAELQQAKAHQVIDAAKAMGW